MEFTNPVDVEIQLLNTLSQVLFTGEAKQTSSEQFNLDLSNYSAGMYFVVIKVGDEVHVEKLIRGE